MVDLASRPVSEGDVPICVFLSHTGSCTGLHFKSLSFPLNFSLRYDGGLKHLSVFRSHAKWCYCFETRVLVCARQMGALISSAEEKRGKQFLHPVPSGLADQPEAKPGVAIKDLTSDQLRLIFQFALKVCA